MKNSVIIGLVQYGLDHELIKSLDVPYVINKMMHILDMDSIDVDLVVEHMSLDILFDLLWESYPDLLGSQKESMRSELMDVLTLNPSAINQVYTRLFEQNKVSATNWFYQYCKNIDYVKSTASNVLWNYEGQLGLLQLTINLAKPEKDPREIALLLEQKNTSEYPKCMLCKENIGFYGTLSKAARTNLRVLPLTLNDESWMMQYSPYSYYNEHLIVFKEKHDPMLVDERTFKRLLDFVDYMPHYFIGSNAGLPIVGGSILNHDHFQGGRHHFPMMDAKPFHEIKKGNMTLELLDWYMATARLLVPSKEDAIRFMTHFFNAWVNFDCEELDIISHTNGTVHQAITPVVKKTEKGYEIYLVPRNNRTSTEYPDGIFHPHPEVHHIKKENIGLIEVLGCAILPGRLKDELQLINDYIGNQIELDPTIEKHHQWIQSFDLDSLSLLDPEDRYQFLLIEVAKRFEIVLNDASVFKRDERSREVWTAFVEDVITRFE